MHVSVILTNLLSLNLWYPLGGLCTQFTSSFRYLCKKALFLSKIFIFHDFMVTRVIVIITVVNLATGEKVCLMYFLLIYLSPIAFNLVMFPSGLYFIWCRPMLNLYLSFYTSLSLWENSESPCAKLPVAFITFCRTQYKQENKTLIAFVPWTTKEYMIGNLYTNVFQYWDVFSQVELLGAKISPWCDVLASSIWSCLQL